MVAFLGLMAGLALAGHSGPARLVKVDGLPALRIGSRTLDFGGGLHVGGGVVLQDWGRGAVRIFRNGVKAETLSLYGLRPPPTGKQPPYSEGMSASVYPELTGAFPGGKDAAFGIVSFRAGEIMGEPTSYQALVRIHLKPVSVEWLHLLDRGGKGQVENQIKVPQRVFSVRGRALLLEDDAFWAVKPDGANGAKWADCPPNGEIVGYADGRYVLIDRSDLPRTAIDAFDLVTRKTLSVFRRSRADYRSWYFEGGSPDSDIVTFGTSPNPLREHYAVRIPDGRTFPVPPYVQPVDRYLLDVRANQAKLFDIRTGKLVQEIQVPPSPLER